MDEKHLVGTIVNNLLFTEAAQDKLIELIWAEFTVDQKKALADEAHRAALGRMEKIVESRLFAIGSERRVNLFAKLISKVVCDVFETENVQATVKAVVKEHLDDALANIKIKVTDLVGVAFRAAIIEAFSHIDTYALRDAVSEAVAKEG
jgi:hypothetical protein